MPKYYLFLLLIFPMVSGAQTLKLKNRLPSFPGGSQFAASISDSNLSLAAREKLIHREIRKGNVPQFYRTLVPVTDSVNINNKTSTIRYYVLPDYLAIGSDADYFYCPMTPVLAQKVARILGCSLPTRKMSDQIYRAATVKMRPQPIPPSPAMTTVPVFQNHSQSVSEQREKSIKDQPLGSLVAGNKKDVVISGKMYKDGKLRVVIYGWHQESAKPIQPLYNGHTADWADYSHGIRLIQKKIWVNGRSTRLKKILKSGTLHPLLSDEGPITHVKYPTKQLAVKQVILK
ncbi:MAG TPA: hypothetical protein VGD90_06150 [Sphingobacteriaceae bacterium]